MENKDKQYQENNMLIGYMLNEAVENIDLLKKEFKLLEQRINTLEREDKKSRVKIVIFIIILIFTYLTASIPKLISIIEAIEKFL